MSFGFEAPRKKPWTLFGVLGRMIAAGLAAVFLLATLGSAIPTAYYVVSGNGSKSWPSVQGTVVHARAVEDLENPSRFDADVKYQYEVNEIAYDGDTIGIGWTINSDQEEIEARVSPYQAGAPVSVHYDPKDPQRSVLETGLYQPVQSAIFGIFAGICALFGLPLAWLAFRPRGTSEAQRHEMPAVSAHQAPHASGAMPVATQPPLDDAVGLSTAALYQEPPAPVSAKTPTAGGGAFDWEKKGIDNGMLGGLAMMAIAVVWFVGGWVCGYVFFYPPILFLIGLFGLLKGVFTGNLNGAQRAY